MSFKVEVFDIGFEVLELKFKELSGFENVVLIIILMGYVDEMFIGDVFEIGFDIDMFEVSFSVVIKFVNVFLDFFVGFENVS